MRYAWRNLWRNRKRTAITLAAVAFNTAILIATFSLIEGMLKQSVGNVTNLVTGEAQVHAPGYLEDFSLYKTLSRPQAILETALSHKVAAAPRCYGYGLISSGPKSAGAFFRGVVPELERKTFDLANHLEEGSYLADKPERGLVLGKKLARSLNVSVGSEVVVVVQAADGSLGNDLYTVTGILKTTGESIDRNAAFLHMADFRELFVLGDRIHEIAFNTRGKFSLKKLVSVVKKVAPKEEIRNWRELLPMFSDMVNLSDVSIWIMGVIFFLAAALGVMNTMLMATYERIHEFGVMKALGVTPWRIIREVAAEALLLSLIATGVGMFLGITGSYYLQIVGIDTTRFVSGTTTMAGVAFDPVWRAALSLKAVVSPVVIMWIICVLAALYPAMVAARLDPVEAMQHV
ncbi:MAG: ABC transporter permease [bacterium]